MKTKKTYTNWATFFFGCLIILLGCNSSASEPVATAVAENALTAPAEVITVRDAVLDFLRDGANECVPPEGVIWRTSSGGEQTPAGYELYRFTSGDDCTITVSYPLENQADSLYHVALGHGGTGFCWQALVNENGQVIKTGEAANSDPEIGNPARIYCEAQGHQYEIVTQPGGLECGQCVFSDGSRCNGWAYLNHMCQPGDNATEDGM
jgi:putative hemolysin